MRKMLFALVLLWSVTIPAAAQDACGASLPTRLTVGQQGLVTVDEGFFLNLRAMPGVNSSTLLRLADGEFFDVIGGPQCVDGILWWKVQQFALTGWIAESASGAYMVEPFDTGVLPTIAVLPSPVPALSPVLLANNPDTLETDFIQWDWETFLADMSSFYQPPDPLTVTLPESYQGTDIPSGPFDLSDVRFVDEIEFTEAQLALLAQNGFVVVPAGKLQFEDAYRYMGDYDNETGVNGWDAETGHSFWVTTDAMLHSLHVAFDNLLQFLEVEQFHSRLRDVLTASYTAAVEGWEAAQDSDLEPAARAAVTYYAVALGLLDPTSYDSVVSGDIRAEADPLLEAAQDGAGLVDVPFMPGYIEDFTQYIPRGHYTTGPEQERYFRAMMWLGRITFLARDDAPLQASLFTLKALRESGQYENWQSISDLLTFLVGPTDNLGPPDYLPIAQDVFGSELDAEQFADPALLAEFRAQIQGLPGPRINNVVRPIGTEAEELDDATRGFRVFGQRFTFDGYAMQRLIYPYVGVAGNERALPSGLDAAAALGSDTAYDLLYQRGDTNYANYVSNLTDLRSIVSGLNGPDWLANAYGGWLWALQPLWARNPESYPPLMSSESWLLRDLQAGLGSWAELKHATLLYTVQPMGGLGGGGERTNTTHSLIEPNPLVFSRVALVAAGVSQGLRERGIGEFDFAGEPPALSNIRGAFDNIAELSAMLTEMARKELWGEPLTDDEQLFLKYDFGMKLWYTRYLAELALADPPEMAAIVADVASNPDAGVVLEAGTGFVDTIYVIADSPDGLHLTRGTVYSYYEFVQPIDERLTDEAWREMLNAGEAPPRPDWVGAFFAE